MKHKNLNDKLGAEDKPENERTPLHPRIEWFYRKWGRFYKNYISIKSLPDENDSRYKQREIGY